MRMKRNVIELLASAVDMVSAFDALMNRTIVIPMAADSMKTKSKLCGLQLWRSRANHGRAFLDYPLQFLGTVRDKERNLKLTG